MGKHFTDKELDRMFTLNSRKGKKAMTPTQIRADLARTRGKHGQAPPDLTSVRRALNGKSHRRGRKETRGRNKKLSAANLKALDSTRKKLIAKAENEHEVHWQHVIEKSGVPKVDPTTAAKNLNDNGYDIAARKPREKPLRPKVGIPGLYGTPRPRPTIPL